MAETLKYSGYTPAVETQLSILTLSSFLHPTMLTTSFASFTHSHPCVHSLKFPMAGTTFLILSATQPAFP